MKNIMNKIMEEAEFYAVDGIDFLTRTNDHREIITLTYFKGELENSFEFNIIELIGLEFDYAEVVAERCKTLSDSVINHKQDGNS